jgi:hypothetical protein
MSGACHRRKGDRIEREIVDRHKTLGGPCRTISAQRRE